MSNSSGLMAEANDTMSDSNQTAAEAPAPVIQECNGLDCLSASSTAVENDSVVSGCASEVVLLPALAVYCAVIRDLHLLIAFIYR